MMTLRDGIEFVRQLEKELYLFNTEPGSPVEDRLVSLFETQNVDIVTKRTSSGKPTIAVLSGRDEVLAVVDISMLRALTEQVSAGPDSTGFADAEYEDILGNLKETTFTSYDAEQLLYASREIEDRARRVGGGTIHAGFQRVSIVNDQQHIYADLARRGLTVHAYGLPDAPVPDVGAGQIHTPETDEIADMWFVIFDGGETTEQKSALIAEERGENDFYGAWTYDAAIVDQLCAYLERTYLCRPDSRKT